MEKARHNRHSHLTGMVAALLLAIISIASCSRYDDDELESRVKLFPIIDSQVEPVVQTRSYVAYVNDRETIHAYCVAFTDNLGQTRSANPSEDDVQGDFIPSLTDATWSSSVNANSNSFYRIYTHTDIPGAGTPTLTYTDSTHITLAFSGLDIISANDPMFSIASAGKLLQDNPNQNTYPTLNDGYFYTFKPLASPTSTPPTSTKVFMRMHHLFAKVTLSFQIDNTYNQIRDIELTEIKISTAGNNGHLNQNFTYDFYTKAFSTPQSSNLEGGEIITSNILKQGQNPDYFIQTTAREYGWFCFIPLNGSCPDLELKVKYNVYDKQGNLLSEREAVNSNLMRNISSPQVGTDYHIKVSVIPTYLGQLSDGDVEFELSLVP